MMPDTRPASAAEARAALAEARLARLLARVEALANGIEVIDAYDVLWLKELRAIAHEARA